MRKTFFSIMNVSFRNPRHDWVFMAESIEDKWRAEKSKVKVLKAHVRDLQSRFDKSLKENERLRLESADLTTKRDASGGKLQASREAVSSLRNELQLAKEVAHDANRRYELKSEEVAAEKIKFGKISARNEKVL
jgi:regulator of replication initiation timing